MNSIRNQNRYIESTVIFALDELKHLAPKMINLGLPKSVKHYNVYKQYQMAIDSFNKNRSNENRLSLNLAKQRYKYLENKLNRQYKNQQGNMLSKLRKSNPKRLYRKFKKRKTTCYTRYLTWEVRRTFQKLNIKRQDWWYKPWYNWNCVWWKRTRFVYYQVETGESYWYW